MVSNNKVANRIDENNSRITRDLPDKVLHDNEFVNFYVKIPNKFLDINSDIKLSPEELYLYYFLYSYRYYRRSIRDNKSFTMGSIDVFDQLISLRRNKRKEVNKNKIKEIIKLLKDKELINIFNKDGNFFKEINKIKNHTALIIEFLKVDESGGYEPIYYDKFTKFKDSREFMIFCIIKKIEGTSYKISYREMASLVDCSKKTIYRIIKKMEEEYKININRGNFYFDQSGSIRKEKNDYMEIL